MQYIIKWNCSTVYLKKNTYNSVLTSLMQDRIEECNSVNPPHHYIHGRHTRVVVSVVSSAPCRNPTTASWPALAARRISRYTIKMPMPSMAARQMRDLYGNCSVVSVLSRGYQFGYRYLLLRRCCEVRVDLLLTRPPHHRTPPSTRPAAQNNTQIVG